MCKWKHGFLNGNEMFESRWCTQSYCLLSFIYYLYLKGGAYENRYQLGELYKAMTHIMRTKRVLNYDSLYTLYCSLFLPYINYCSEIWGNTYKTKLNSIILIQKKLIRAICGINDMRTNTSPFSYKCCILKFVDLTAYKTLIVMFKVKNNVLPIGIQSIFTINSNSYNTRQSGKFNQKYVRTTMKSLTVSVAGVKLWNSLKTNITTIKKICVFKKMCKPYFLGK